LLIVILKTRRNKNIKAILRVLSNPAVLALLKNIGYCLQGNPTMKYSGIG
jgi:hypothetical protein